MYSLSTKVCLHNVTQFYNTFNADSSENLAANLLTSLVTPSNTSNNTSFYTRKELKAKLKFIGRKLLPSVQKNALIAFEDLVNSNNEKSNIFPGHKYLAKKYRYSERTSKSVMTLLNDLGLVLKTRRGCMKSNLYQINWQIVLERQDLLEGYFSRVKCKSCTLLDTSKEVDISNVTNEKNYFKNKKGEFKQSKVREMPRDEKEEKELFEKFNYYPANKKRLDALGWEKAASMKKAFSCYLRKTPIPKYYQDQFNTIFWTEEVINVYFPTWLKGTLARQKQYGSRFMHYHVRDEFKVAKANGAIKYEPKDDPGYYSRINNQRLKEQALQEQENSFNFQSILEKPTIKQIKRLTVEETLAMIAEQGIDNILGN